MTTETFDTQQPNSSSRQESQPGVGRWARMPLWARRAAAGLGLGTAVAGSGLVTAGTAAVAYEVGSRAATAQTRVLAEAGDSVVEVAKAVGAEATDIWNGASDDAKLFTVGGVAGASVISAGLASAGRGKRREQQAEERLRKAGVRPEVSDLGKVEVRPMLHRGQLAFRVDNPSGRDLRDAQLDVVVKGQDGMPFKGRVTVSEVRRGTSEVLQVDPSTLKNTLGQSLKNLWIENVEKPGTTTVKSVPNVPTAEVVRLQATTSDSHKLDINVAKNTVRVDNRPLETAPDHGI